ncbi:MAG: ABC transporter ATP-binding protein [Anaerolineales bacterium]
MALVEIQNLTYQYPVTEKPALKDINLQIEEGEFVAVIGPNESGKSTLSYAVSGFVPHFFRGDIQGTIKVDGLHSRESSLNEWVLHVGLAFQNPFNQISGSKFTVFEEIAFGLENIGVTREEMKKRVHEIMEMTGISELGDRSPYALSGGQQQRVALASILVMEPKVLVLDEPTSQLDPIGTRQVFQVIKEMSARGMTVLLTEHKIEWIAEFADRVVALLEGKIIAQGPPHRVLTSPSLREQGFGFSRYTAVAEKAREQGLWPQDRRLPVTLDEAVDGFTRGFDEN